MTFHSEGTLGGRRFAVIRDPQSQEPKRYRCLECSAEKSSPEAFTSHTCEAPARAARKTSPPTEVSKDEAGKADRPAGQD